MTGGTDTLGARVAALQEALRTAAGIEPAADLDALQGTQKTGSPRPPPGPRSLAHANLILDHHFELRCDLLVYDDLFGTVGLVHFQNGAAPWGIEQEDQLAWCRRTVESAAYLRHLALTKAQKVRPELPLLPLTVELVLVLPVLPDLSGLGDALRDIARESNFLHGIGVHLLGWNGPSATPDAEAALRTAFCWTLPTLKRWYGPKREAEAKIRFTGIELTNWRLPGTRSFRLDGEATVHMVHGANGSGKSSLVEAIEYLATGSIDRLHDPQDVARIVEHAPDGKKAPLAAQVRFLEGGTLHDTRSGPPVEPLGTPSAGAFRLNQPVMDRLAVVEDAERIRYFVETFFPEYEKAATAYRNADEAAHKAREELPQRIKESLPSNPRLLPEILSERLAWAAGEDIPMSDVRANCMALSREDLIALVPLAPQLGPVLDMAVPDRLPADRVAGFLDSYDKVLEPLARDPDSLLRRIAAAREVLGMADLADWQPSESTSSTATAKALNTWLRSATAVAMMRRHIEIVRSLDRARRASELPLDEIVPPALAHVASNASHDRLQQLETALRDLIDQENTAQRHISGIGRGTERREGTGVVRPVLTDTQIQALDGVTAFLTAEGEVAGDRLGGAVARAIAENKTMPAGRGTVGMAGWTRVLDEQLGELVLALDALRAVPRAERLPGPVWAAIRTVCQAQSTLAVAAGDLSKQFLDRIFRKSGSTAPGEAEPPLTEAIDELMTLLTPARWAYPRIGIEYGADAEGRPAMSIRFGDLKDGELRLNTAELNLLTLSLFLLCAPKVSNPLHLVILDDPLQNMDEMTVTVLARGLARISLLLGEPWRLILFFHGEDDFERVRQEVPGAYYRLPWLLPVNDRRPDASKDMSQEDKVWRTTGRQSLSDLESAPANPSAVS